MKMLLTIALSALCMPSTIFCSDLRSMNLQEGLLQAEQPEFRVRCNKRLLTCSGLTALVVGIVVVSSLGKSTTTPCQALTIAHCGSHCPSPQVFSGICPPPPGRGYDTGALSKYCSLTTPGDKITVGQDTTDCTQATCRSFPATEEYIHATCPMSLSAPASTLTPQERFNKKLEMLKNNRTGR